MLAAIRMVLESTKLLWFQIELSHDPANLFLIHKNALLVTHNHRHPTTPEGLLGLFKQSTNHPVYW
jgi:hypothetical protein